MSVASLKTNKTIRHNQPTVAILPPRASSDRTSYQKSRELDSSNYECLAFQDEFEYDAYVDSISPSRELVCPITQEVLQDPVVAEDGHTYERSALMRWFSMGRTRSPVTNSIMTRKKVFPNMAIQGMAQAHREKLGLELLERGKIIVHNKGKCPDNGSRIAALLDAGASTSLRDDKDGDTALLMFIQAPNLHLVKTLLQHDSSSVMLSNNKGITCIQAIEEHIRAGSGIYGFRRDKNKSNALIYEWKIILEDVKKKVAAEKVKIDAKDDARNRANEEHRQQQRTLAAAARANSEIGNSQRSNRNNLRGLGELEDGWGYFPSLVALQFQSSIPPPSASFADMERKQKEKLSSILKFFGFFIVFFLFWF